MTEAHGDAEAVAMVRAFRNRALHVLGPGDELVETIGDAIMLRFRTAEAAITALRQLLQRELVVNDAVLLPCAGAHHGHAVLVDGDCYGAAVNLAARVGGEAGGDDPVVTDPVCQMRVPTTGHAAIALDWSGRRLHFRGLPASPASPPTPSATSTEC